MIRGPSVRYSEFLLVQESCGNNQLMHSHIRVVSISLHSHPLAFDQGKLLILSDKSP